MYIFTWGCVVLRLLGQYSCWATVREIRESDFMFSALYLYLKKHKQCLLFRYAQSCRRPNTPNNFWYNFWILINFRMNVMPLFLLCRPEQGSSGGDASDSCLGCTRFEFRQERQLSWSRFCASALPPSSGILLWNRASCTRVTRCFPGVKRVDRGDDNLPPSVEVLRMGRSYNSTFSHCL